MDVAMAISQVETNSNDAPSDDCFDSWRGSSCLNFSLLLFPNYKRGIIGFFVFLQ
jgi:hypothetical protein